MDANGTQEGSGVNESEVRRYIEAVFQKLTPAKAQEIARSLAQGGGKEQVRRLAHDLMEWSTKSRAELTEIVDRQVGEQLRRNRERLAGFVEHQVKEQFRTTSARLTEAVQREVRRQVKALGVATKGDLDALRRRVRELERGAGVGPAAAGRPTRKKPVAKKRVAKKPASASGS
jgi:BMFP domain-containing protein YqiC